VVKPAAASSSAMVWYWNIISLAIDVPQHRVGECEGFDHENRFAPQTHR
jgi:hypothetical protein